MKCNSFFHIAVSLREDIANDIEILQFLHLFHKRNLFWN
jgi:hypothetical protein